jgi:glycosyltransferase involved in cell wall biosynthesis
MKFFGERAIKNFGFERYDSFTDLYKPVLFLGLYNENDLAVFKEHRGRKAIFWNGSDVLWLKQNALWQATIKTFPNARHACHNQLLQTELAEMGLEAVIAPIFFSCVEDYPVSFTPSVPLNVYLMAHEKVGSVYGVPIVEEIADQTTGILFHVYGVTKLNTQKILYHGTVPESQMDAEIKDYQVCLRLNKHDGFSQTLIKSILLGQYQISAISYANLEVYTNAKTLIKQLNALKSERLPDLRAREFYLPLLNDFSWLKKRKNDIALVMTVKNEGLGLEKAILSCLDFVDQVVVSVDSKSSDNTLQIAQKYADVVKIHDWENDFSKVRNFAHAGVETKWILFIDGHEYVERVEGLRAMLGSSADGLLTQVIMETGFSFLYPRIYKNGLQFEGAVHNSLPVKSPVKYKDFVIKHDRENMQSPFAIVQRNQQRDKMILSIMGDRVKKNKKDTRGLFYLGIFYLNSTDLKTAISYFKKYLKYSTATGERYSACFNIAFCYYTQKRFTKALKYFSLADREEPGRWETVKFSGMCYMGFQRWDKALACLVESFKTSTRDYFYNPWPVDHADTWNSISLCFLGKGEWEKAKIACQEALKTIKNPAMKAEIDVRLKLLERIEEVRR